MRRNLLVLAIFLNFFDFGLPKKAFVERVIDGDTIVLKGGKVVRYIGIDTPEIREKENGKWIYSPQPFALEAKELNEKLVEKKWVSLEYDVEKKDRYGRLLGYVFVDNTFVNAKLIEEGLAFLYTSPPNVKYVDKFLTLQKKAREAGWGIWGIYTRGSISDKEAKEHIGELAEVVGRIVKTGEKEKLVILYFGQGKKDDFKVVIFKKDEKYFRERKIILSTYYTGKKVKVYGKIRYHFGPEMIVHHPAQIEIME
ncbi:MAG: thermonuclease family protein [Candidatus Omnitrophica bacterium]|nr:thermonuclease family protein [Candidatus Omnitrophota bacterium]